MKIKTQIIITSLIIYSLFLAGCPSSKTIADAKKASIKIATSADVGVNLTRDLFRSNLISLEQKDRIADAFIVLSRAGIAFDKAVANAEAVYGSEVPRSEIEKLFATFDAEIVSQFLSIIALIKPLQRAGEYGRVIELIKTAVLLAAKAFGKHATVSAKLAVA